MQFLGLVQRKAADCHTSQDALHLMKELDSFQAELSPSQQRRIDEIKLLTRNHGMTLMLLISRHAGKSCRSGNSQKFIFGYPL